MMIKKETYIAPAMEVILITGSSAVLFGSDGSDSPSFDYGNNDLGELL